MTGGATIPSHFSHQAGSQYLIRVPPFHAARPPGRTPSDGAARSLSQHPPRGLATMALLPALLALQLLFRPALAVNMCSGTMAGSFALVNVTVIGCSGSALTDASGRFSIPCTSDACTCSPTACEVSIWARQYLPITNLRVPTPKPGAPPGPPILLRPRPIPGFPAKDWRFEGWAVEAQTGDVPGTDVGFLAHPSAYRPPSGDRIFLTSTANAHAGPGWTQAYWQEGNITRAVAAPSQLVNRSNPAMMGTAFTGNPHRRHFKRISPMFLGGRSVLISRTCVSAGRMVVVDGRLVRTFNIGFFIVHFPLLFCPFLTIKYCKWRSFICS